ncbi:hypothetical protein BRC90_09005 [Halobacteriales archaeon QS_4_69_34]|nr:MAG: hypothetical protein BRC90_09005 [Halobacteriales archaeon QS_4_69_34]
MPALPGRRVERDRSTTRRLLWPSVGVLYEELPERFAAEDVGRKGLTGGRRHLLVRHFADARRSVSSPADTAVAGKRA